MTIFYQKLFRGLLQKTSLVLIANCLLLCSSAESAIYLSYKEAFDYFPNSKACVKASLAGKGIDPTAKIETSAGFKNMNFGILIYNPYFKIYRSSGLGEEGLEVLKSSLETSVLSIPNKIIYMNHYGYRATLSSWIKSRWYDFQDSIHQTKTFHTGQFAREEHQAAPKNHGAFDFEFVHSKEDPVYLDGLHPYFDHPDYFDHPGQARAQFYNVLREILITDGAVLFHCKGGVHRTGMTALLIRSLQGGPWTHNLNQPLIVETKTRTGIFSFEKNTNPLMNLAELEYYLHNPDNFRVLNLRGVQALVKEEKFRCLKRKFSPFLNALPEHPKVADHYEDLQEFFDPKQINWEFDPSEFTSQKRLQLWNECEDQEKQ